MIDEGDSIDLARAKASEARARDRLEQHQEGLDVTRAQASLARALVRIEAKQLSSGGKKA
jgi:F0F1-type ATP synthase epsilon subunit